MEKKVYLSIDGKDITFSFIPCRTDSDKLYQELRKLGGGGSGSGVCLEDSLGNTLRITPSLPSNTPQSKYNLLVYSDNGMLIDDVNTDLISVEKRISELESQLKINCQTMPSVVTELKKELELFRKKLETTKHLSWLSYYKDLPPTSRKLEYRRRSDAKQKLVREQFYQICEQVLSEEVRQCLRLSTFDCMQWSDEEILHLLQWMFLDFDFPRLFAIPMVTLRSFLFTVYKNYNEVPFHNFRHCFCVAQMMYAISWEADLVKRLGSLEVLILLVSCICHDLDHPGYNNIYQINAKTELALRYNDISPLENHHCSIAFRILDLPDCNIFSSFNSEQYKSIREGIIRCILATDMARHNEILAQFKDAVAQGFDFSNRAHVNLLTMVLIKVADISNEARPMDVAEPWLDRLLQEFFSQSDAEKEEGLPVTPFMDREKITKPSSQCSFIGFVLLPLFEALCQLLTELQPMILEPVKFALDYYRRLNEATAPPSPHGPLTKSPSSVTFRKTSIAFSQGGDNDSEMLDGGVSTEEEETVTEVAVSEKALKFKISTESSSSGRKSYPGSRKGSRERSHEQDLSWSLRGSDSGEKRSWEGCEACSRRHTGRSQSLVEPPGQTGVMAKTRSVSAGGSPDGIRDFHHHHHHHHCDSSKSHDPPLKTIGEGCLLKESSSPPLPTTVELVENCGETKKTSSPGGLFRRLKSLGGRLKEVPGSPASLRSVPVPKEETRRAMTLPKVRAGQRPTKRWRTILKISKHHSIALGEESVNNNRKGEGTSRGSSPSRTSKRWVHSLVSSIRGKRSPQDPQSSHLND